MAYDLVIRGGRVVAGGATLDADVAVRDGRIAALGEGLRGADEIDARGRIVMPGGVDPHAHIEQLSSMGIVNADTFESATRSAAMGGTTSVICFAAQARGQRLADAVSDYAERAARGAMVDHAFHILVSDPDVPRFAEDLADLAAAGHRSVKVFMTYMIRLDDSQLMDVLHGAAGLGMLTCVHAENDAMIGWTKARLLAAGKTRPLHHAVSHPRLAEVEAIERVCRYAEFLDAPVMVFHVSTAEGAAALAAARARGAPVAGETCPQYLLMEAGVLDRPGVEGAKWMCSPPQRTVADQESLWNRLLQGDLEVISSDHAPYRFDATGKLIAGPEPSFDRIANGLPGLEPRLPLLFDAMVTRGRGGAAAFARLTAEAPARLHGLADKGRIAVGADADLVIWDPERRVTYGPDDLHDNVGYNPWEGRTVQGWPDTVILRGRRLVEGGAFLGIPGEGRFLARTGHGVAPRGAPAAEVLASEAAG